MIAGLIFVFALAAASPGADIRGPTDTVVHKHFFCVKNAESGACEDCWSDSSFSSAKGTCRLLKSSTQAPAVRSGKCDSSRNVQFCKRN